MIFVTFVHFLSPVPDIHSRHSNKCFWSRSEESRRLTSGTKHGGFKKNPEMIRLGEKENPQTE